MTSPVLFLKQTYAELRQVKWPTKNEVIRLTLIVIFISFLIGIYIGGLDYLFTQMTSFLIK